MSACWGLGHAARRHYAQQHWPLQVHRDGRPWPPHGGPAKRQQDTEPAGRSQALRCGVAPRSVRLLGGRAAAAARQLASLLAGRGCLGRWWMRARGTGRALGQLGCAAAEGAPLSWAVQRPKLLSLAVRSFHPSQAWHPAEARERLCVLNMGAPCAMDGGQPGMFGPGWSCSHVCRCHPGLRQERHWASCMSEALGMPSVPASDYARAGACTQPARFQVQGNEGCRA